MAMQELSLADLQSELGDARVRIETLEKALLFALLSLRERTAALQLCSEALSYLGFPQEGRKVHPGKTMFDIGWHSPEAIATANEALDAARAALGEQTVQPGS